MFALSGVTRDYAWGSPTAIPEFLGESPTGTPVAETWFGAHSSAPSPLPATSGHLAGLIATDPHGTIGPRVMADHGDALPFLVKILAPSAPLSLQVHPSKTQAQDGYTRARAGGPDAPVDYVDRNHKPELLYPLSEFEALCGLRSAQQIIDSIAGLRHPLLGELRETLQDEGGVGAAFAHVLQHTDGDAVEAIAGECESRLAQGDSPAPDTDEILGRLFETYPEDPGVVASLLLTPRRLQPGEMMFIPPGVLHVYLDGLGLEVMANSDNVLRAGLTPKNVDIVELLNVLDPQAGAEFPSARAEGDGIHRIPLPVEDFELHVIDGQAQEVELDYSGPRIVVARSGGTVLRAADPYSGSARQLELERGQAAFLAHEDEGVCVTRGSVFHVGVPTERT